MGEGALMEYTVPEPVDAIEIARQLFQNDSNLHLMIQEQAARIRALELIVARLEMERIGPRVH